MKSDRIREFTVIGADAWNWVFLYAVLEERLDGTYILVADDKETRSICIEDADVFIRQINDTGIESINGNTFDEWVEDGFSWMIHLVYDSKDILVGGHSAVPDEAINLLNIIGCGWEHNSRSQKKSMRKKRIKADERVKILCHHKEMNRFLRELWGEKPLYAPTYLDAFI